MSSLKEASKHIEFLNLIDEMEKLLPFITKQDIDNMTKDQKKAYKIILEEKKGSGICTSICGDEYKNARRVANTLRDDRLVRPTLTSVRQDFLDQGLTPVLANRAARQILPLLIRGYSEAVMNPVRRLRTGEGKKKNKK